MITMGAVVALGSVLVWKGINAVESIIKGQTHKVVIPKVAKR